MELDRFQLAAYAISVTRHSDYSRTAGEPSIAMTVSVYVCLYVTISQQPHFQFSVHVAMAELLSGGSAMYYVLCTRFCG